MKRIVWRVFAAIAAALSTLAAFLSGCGP